MAQPQQKVRQSNFEILRIISMYLIVTQHYSGQTKWGNFERAGVEGPEAAPTKLLHHQLMVNIMTTGGKVGVNIFLMLSGYFLKGRPMKAASIARTWSQTLMWSYMIFGYMWTQRPMWYGDYIRGFFPVIGFGYWFLSTYIATMLLTAGIAAAAVHTTPKQLVGILLVQFVIMGCMNWDNYTAYSNISWFSFGTMLGAAIRRFERPLRRGISTRVLLWLIGIVLVVNWYSVYVFTTQSAGWAKSVDWANRHGGVNALMRENHSPMAVFMAILVFLLVMRIQLASSFINTAASLTLGVYLTHENFFIAPQIWDKWVRGQDYEHLTLFPLIAVAQITAVYVACSFAEYLRQKLLGDVERIMVKIALVICDWVERRIVNPIVPTQESLEESIPMSTLNSV